MSGFRKMLFDIKSGSRLFDVETTKYLITKIDFAPRAGAWIETDGDVPEARGSGSRPARARGLKLGFNCL